MTEPTKESPPEPESSINITFPAGPHTTGLEIRMAYVDAAQLEISGYFLLRQAASQYDAAQAAAQAGKLVIPTPGSVKLGN